LNTSGGGAARDGQEPAKEAGEGGGFGHSDRGGELARAAIGQWVSPVAFRANFPSFPVIRPVSHFHFPLFGPLRISSSECFPSSFTTPVSESLIVIVPVLTVRMPVLS
jgi:hypothetical protein